MRRLRLLARCFARCLAPIPLLALATLVACGPPGATGVPSGSFQVTSTGLGPCRSGQRVRWPLRISGGAGGPYLVRRIAGALPPGLSLARDPPAIEGTLLLDGLYQFTLEVLDLGAHPFLSCVATWRVAVEPGDVAIVGATRNGASALAWPSDDAPVGALPVLDPVVYDEWTVVSVVVAGGEPPYRLAVVSGDASGDGGALPLGVAIPAGSTALVGAPVEVGPGGGAFTFTLEATDARGRSGRLTVRWTVDTPPVSFVTAALPDGVAGAPYEADIVVQGGVPPFWRELVRAAPADDYTVARAPMTADVVYEPGGPPLVDPPDALTRIDASVYPPEDLAGPDYRTAAPGAPPEGLRLVETTGRWHGVPRRRGTFRVHAHVRSTVLPDAYGQHAWRTFDLSFAPAALLALDPGLTTEGTLSSAPPYAHLPAAERTVPYDPDGGTPGLSLRATGGVGKDGWTDAPHESEALRLSGGGEGGETDGGYTWSVDLDPDHDGGRDPVPAMELDAERGLWRATDPDALVPQQPQEIRFTARDEALPLAARQVAGATVLFEVGPDVVIVTESTTSSSATGADTLGLDDAATSIRVLEPFSSGAVLRDPSDAQDLAATHEVPAPAGEGVDLATLLSGIDCLRVSVNPNGWWDDVTGLDPRAARPLQHGDRNAYVPYVGTGYVGATVTTSTLGACQPDATAVELPACTSPDVVDDPATGTYASGGRLFVFDAAERFGVFVIRRDGRIDVPIAFEKTTWVRFGDSWSQPWSSEGTHSLVNLPEMAVSPDGRFAAMKLAQTYDRLENVETTPIVLFTLTGERPAAWGGREWHVVDVGSDGSDAEGRVAFASSLALTDRFAYVLAAGGDVASWSWKEHHVYRIEILSSGSAGALLEPDAYEGWTNAPGRALQTPFERYVEPFTEGPNRPGRSMVGRGGYDATETSLASHPFRVSADGRSIAILAAPAPSGTEGPDVRRYRAWVDQDGTLYPASGTPRRVPRGGGRGYALRDGPEIFPRLDAGSRSGPTPSLEISDDGLSLALVVSRAARLDGDGGGADAGPLARDDVVLLRAADGASWSSGVVEAQVTGSESGAAPVFSGPTVWRFGALAFAREGGGLFFWGGFSAAGPAATEPDAIAGRHRAKSYVGTLYAYDPGRGQVVSILDARDGGASEGAGAVHDAAHPVLGPTAAWSAAGGVVKPVGGFVSPNGCFLYLVNAGALSEEDPSDHALLGVPVRSLDGSRSIGGHPDGRAFRVAGMPGRRGFLPRYGDGPWSYVGIGSARYDATSPAYYGQHAPGGATGAGLQVLGAGTGRVFFVTHEQRQGPLSVGDADEPYEAGGPVRDTAYGDAGHVNGHVAVFDADLGGPVSLLTVPGLGPASSAASRPVVYVEVAPGGGAVAFVYGDGGTVAYYREKVAIVTGIDLDPATGELRGEPTFRALTGERGRAGPEMGFDSTGARLYFSFGPAADENEQQLVRVRVGAAAAEGGPTSYAFPERRYGVLFAGR